jgi:hypothetical protein
MTKDEFLAIYVDTKSNLRIIGECGHGTVVQFNNLLYTNTGVICKKCHYEKFSNDQKCTNKDYHVQEYSVIKGLQQFCNGFEFNISPEGCLADFSIRPKGTTEDVWLPLQLKTTKKVCHGKYNFSYKSDYKDMDIIFFGMDKQRIWIINHEHIKHKALKTLNIGENTSELEKYEIGTNDLPKIFMDLWNKGHTYTLNNIRCMSPLLMQREHEFHVHRESLFPNLRFTYPEIDARIYDAIVNNAYKIQDKVISCRERKRCGMPRESKPYKQICAVKLCKTNRKKYCMGQNDFYWLSLADKSGAYIIPQQILYEQNIIAGEGEDSILESNITLHPYVDDSTKFKYGCLNKHLYHFGKQGDIDRINELFTNKKNIVMQSDISTFKNFEIVGKNILNRFDKQIVHALVTNAFHNVVKMAKEQLQAKIQNIKTTQRVCEVCSEKILHRNKSGTCVECYQQTKNMLSRARRPCHEELIAEILASNYTQVGKKYGVSDNAVRKWVKQK